MLMQVRVLPSDHHVAQGSQLPLLRKQLYLQDTVAATESPEVYSRCPTRADTNSNHWSNRVGAQHDAGGNLAWSDESQGGSGSRESCCFHRSTTNAQNNRSNSRFIFLWKFKRFVNLDNHLHYLAQVCWAADLCSFLLWIFIVGIWSFYI